MRPSSPPHAAQLARKYARMSRNRRRCVRRGSSMTSKASCQTIASRTSAFGRAVVQAHDDRPRRRLLEVLAAQGYAPNQKLVLMSDGGESVRRLVARIGPEAEHVLDWFHVTMRLTVLRQMTKGACPADPGWT